MAKRLVPVPVEWVIQDHARKRALERHGREIDVEGFRTTSLVRDGLRLWLDDEDNGIMVREDAGTGWVRHSVVTALSRAMVDAARSGRLTHRPFRNVEIPPTPKMVVMVSGHEARQIIAEILARSGPMSTSRLVKLSGFNRTDTCNFLRDLRVLGRVVQAGSKWSVPVPVDARC